jgi:hypothetical protein
LPQQGLTLDIDADITTPDFPEFPRNFSGGVRSVYPKPTPEFWKCAGIGARALFAVSRAWPRGDPLGVEGSF